MTQVVLAEPDNHQPQAPLATPQQDARGPPFRAAAARAVSPEAATQVKALPGPKQGREAVLGRAL